MVFQPKNLASVLPWDLVDAGVSKTILRRELEKAKGSAAEGKREVYQPGRS
jgi:tagatose-1,6-bisphosphate aldolase